MSIATTTPIDTGKVTSRRTLRFHSIDEALTEANRLAEAERQGRLTQVGNWTLGQALGHIAGWTEFGYNGFPIGAPWFVRLIVWFQRKKFLYGAIPAGVKIPGVIGGTLATEPVSLDDGLGRFQATFQRLKTEPQKHPSPVLGKLTHEESIALNLRHAELHLSFFTPR
jgi:hypothetical protein